MLVERGVKTEIDVPPGQTLNDPFSGNLADVCPVGSLTTREFRFRSRPWEMTAVESTCTACPVGCSNTLWSRRGVMQRMTSRANPEVNDYWLCDRGRFDINFVNSEQRLLKPRLSAEASESASWDEAAHAFAGMVRSSVKPWAVVASPHATNEEYFAVQRFARRVLKTPHLILDTGPGGPELSAGRVRLLRSGRMLSAVSMIDRADVIVQAGGNLESTHPVYSLRVRKAVRNSGARLFLGTAGAGGLDQETAHRERVLPGEEEGYLARLEETVSRAARGVLIVNAGARNESLLPAIDRLLNLNPSGLSLLLLDDGPNVTGAWDMGFSSGYAPGYVPAAEPGRSRRELTEGLGSGELGGLLMFSSGRPWTFSPDIIEAANSVSARITFDLLPGSHHAGSAVLFPAPSMAEVDGTVTAPDHRVLLVRRSVAGPDGLWHPAQVLARVEGLLGGERRAGQPVDVFRDISREVPGYEGMNFGRLRPLGLPWKPALTAAGAAGGRV
jgi:NADH-quinone oxidoreductase subunit G